MTCRILLTAPIIVLLFLPGVLPGRVVADVVIDMPPPPPKAVAPEPAPPTTVPADRPPQASDYRTPAAYPPGRLALGRYVGARSAPEPIDVLQVSRRTRFRGGPYGTYFWLRPYGYYEFHYGFPSFRYQIYPYWSYYANPLIFH